MPLIYLNAPDGTFSDAARDALAEELTVIALESEKLPMAPFDKSTTWIYFRSYAGGHVYHGGRPGGTKVISLEINAFRGGLDDEAKLSLYRRFTDAIGRHAEIEAGARVPVYIVLREVDPPNWGVFGATTRIEELRKPHPDLNPI